MDILRTDGAIRRADGARVRAATTCEAGAMGDRLIHASARLQRPVGSSTVPGPGKMRFGSRIILADGRPVSVMEVAPEQGWPVSDGGSILAEVQDEEDTIGERASCFRCRHGKTLPKPEEFILARSARRGRGGCCGAGRPGVTTSGRAALRPCPSGQVGSI
jgi:hypothetical protein